MKPRHLMSTALVLLLCAVTTIAIADSKTWWVSSTGNDAYSGASLDSAFATIMKAFSVLDDSSWYFLGYDSLEIILASDQSYTFTADSTLSWGGEDDLELYVHARMDQSGKPDTITVSGSKLIASGQWDEQIYGTNTMLRALWDYEWPPAEPFPAGNGWLQTVTSVEPFLVRDMLIAEDGDPFYYRHKKSLTGTWTTTDFTVLNDSVFVLKDKAGFEADAPLVAPILRVDNVKGVWLQNLGFTDSNPSMDGGMVEINAVDGVRIDSCSFRHSNWTGLRILNSPRSLPTEVPCCGEVGVNIVNSTANYNGMMGIYIGGSHHISIVDCATDSNGWNGYNHYNLLYKTGGLVLYGVNEATVVDHQASRNDARGGWIFGGSAVQVLGSTFDYNDYDGITVSSSPGRIGLSGCTFSSNNAPTSGTLSGYEAAGVRNSVVKQLAIFNCTLDGNDVQYMLGATFAGYIPNLMMNDDECGCSELFMEGYTVQTPLVLAPTSDTFVDVILRKDAGQKYTWYDEEQVDSLTWVGYKDDLLQLDIQFLTSE